MNILFVHQNFPGQYLHLAQHLNSLGGNNIVGIGEADNIKMRGTMHGITTFGYPKPKGAGDQTHHYLQGTEAEVRRGQSVVRALLLLKQKGFSPDVICVHPGWGEGLFVRDVFPDTPILMFAEFFFNARQADLSFDPEFSRGEDWEFSVRVRNASQLISLSAANICHSPTLWQTSRYPLWLQKQIEVIHDGIDTNYMRPKAEPRLVIQPLKTLGESRIIRVGAEALVKTERERTELSIQSKGEPITLTKGQKIITYMARNLEPYRGFHTFMRTIPLIQKEHPQTEILIVGGESTSYSPNLPNGQTYKQKYLDEMRDSVDFSKVHFLGKIPYMALREMFCLSLAHVYLTYPFVLSWSVLEAMSCEALVIASNTAPVKEVITNGINGLLVDFFDIKALADKVSQAISSPKDFSTIKSQGRKTVVEKYNLPLCLNQQSNLLNDLALGKYPTNY